MPIRPFVNDLLVSWTTPFMVLAGPPVFGPGMRRGELCALRWSDIDLDAARIVVRRTVGRIENQLVFKDRPKSDHGRRTIDLDPTTVVVLRAHRRAQLEHRMAFGGGWPDHDLVFTRFDGSPVHPDRMAAVFDRRVAKAPVKRIRFHDLRHTHCAHLIGAKQDPKLISKRMGHASVAFTLDRYGHLFAEADSNAAAAVAALVDGAPA
jgi:integrase